jgi:hypothetical protein
VIDQLVVFASAHSFVNDSHEALVGHRLEIAGGTVVGVWVFERGSDAYQIGGDAELGFQIRGSNEGVHAALLGGLLTDQVGAIGDPS